MTRVQGQRKFSITRGYQWQTSNDRGEGCMFVVYTTVAVVHMIQLYSYYDATLTNIITIKMNTLSHKINHSSK